MIAFEDMPDDNAELVNIMVRFTHLQPDSEDSCPAAIEEVVSYLRLESPDYDSVQADQLRFLRTAQVADRCYWIWSFVESDGNRCFVTVSESPDGTTRIGYEEDYYGLTPEQYMFGDYHGVF